MALALSLSDLVERGDGPRIPAIRLGFALEMRDPHAVRRIVERNRRELASYGEVSDATSETSPYGGRPGREFWLNEAQALLVCMFARTPKAAEVRHQVIRVFLAWRRSEQMPAASTPPAPALPPPDPFLVARDRIDVAMAQVALHRDALPEPLALAVAASPAWSNGRRPAFWADLPVRTLLTGAHRQMQIATALEICRRQFGDRRTPSKSALHRYWMVLDRVRGARA